MAVEVATGQTAAARRRGGARRRWAVTPQGITRDRVLVVALGDAEPTGALKEALAASGRTVEVVSVTAATALPEPTDHVILLGAPAGREVTWSARELEWIAAADAAGTAILATGAAAHALAVAFGGRSEPAAQPRRGWFTVASSDPAVIERGPWFVWQERTLTLPADAEVIATGAGAPQAFRIGAHLGVPLHPEVTSELVRSWVAASDEVLDSQGFGEATERDLPLSGPSARRLVAGFLASAA